MNFNCYSQRLLNPFRGVMNVIEFDGAEAVTTNGMHWDIYVRDTELVRDIEDTQRIQTSDIRYGSWSKKQGLKRGPIYPSDDFKALEHRGALVYEYLLNHHHETPFPFADKFEHWLLDRKQQPLALIDSTTDPRQIDPDALTEWRAGQRCQKFFQSASWEQAGILINKLVNQQRHPDRPACWFRRTANGDGVTLDSQVTLPAEAFPRYFIQERIDSHHQQLIQDYIAWLSPYLLLLHTLEREERAIFERHAIHQALVVEEQFRLYPELIDESTVAAARVEAQLRSQMNEPELEQEEAMSTFYIELNNITRTN